MLFFVMYTKLDQTGLSWFELAKANNINTDGLKLMLMLCIKLQWKVPLLGENPVIFRFDEIAS